jgi:hypothetical protein
MAQSFGVRGGGGGRQIKKNKKRCGVALFTHASQMHFAFDLHNRMEGLFSELISYFSLMKMDKPLGMLLDLFFE